MTLTGSVVKKIIHKLVAGQDYRVEVLALIDAQFLQYVIEFFTRVLQAKMKNETITVDWYKQELLSPDLPKDEIAIHSGLNMKTISNAYQTTTRQVVIDASLKHYEELLCIIEELVGKGEVDITLTIKFNKASVELNLNESLIVINTIAVKRAALRGGLWSTAGKQVEKPLMATLCQLFQVPPEYFDQGQLPASLREVDFYLLQGQSKHRCEVKLMGKGNPESADAVIARDSRVFVADTLSATNKKQLDSLKVLWVELRAKDGYKKFGSVLQSLKNTLKPFQGDLVKAVDKILASMPDEVVEVMAKEIENPVAEKS